MSAVSGGQRGRADAHNLDQDLLGNHPPHLGGGVRPVDDQEADPLDELDDGFGVHDATPFPVTGTGQESASGVGKKSIRLCLPEGHLRVQDPKPKARSA